MKATDLIINHGIDYARGIIRQAPSNATMWNEGFEFRCGQSSTSISKEDREKHFVDMADIKRLVNSVDIINNIGGVKFAKDYLRITGSTSEKTLENAIVDYDSIYGGIK
ncbi:hypothetical protein N5J48_12400 [Acinetobacter ursingii]|uniref:hypothetical protein n=1 Tax=Acinetobacter ursingii TaxID=108980 RepID=UPI0024480318|nr:hypothetical protein [Acinetobacter ursingii]MDH0008374.1 hypothetical protein [Acinetobacter ursingii]MDH0480174.1 hypothetical protein [Acinetobacter ursingii]MDH2120782.1 hypothetical protein [Acinetobacter ursingii]MDH2128352.1 hypothetical protein [Acinetobacter ursingii]